VSAPRQGTPGVLGMIAAGLQGTARQRRLAVALYLVQLFVSLLFLVIVERALASTFGHRPLFAHGVAGNTEALLLSFGPHMAATHTLAITGMGLVFGYLVLSLFLTGGLVGVFAGRSFGDAALRGFVPYLRLWLWSLIPYAVCAAVIAIGMKLAGGGDIFERLISLKLLLMRPLLFVVPGLVVLAITMCAVDYARAELIVGERRGAIRALLGSFRFVVRNPNSLAHYGLYLLFWMAISVLYVMATFGHPFAGAGGAWALFALRQLVSLVRFGARVATTGGQVALVLQASAPPPGPSP
jgi:hypothetical protein